MRDQNSAAAATPFSTGSARVADSSHGCLLDLSALFLLSMAVFVSLILWFDNAQGSTSNGVFKAVTIKAWVSDHLGPSNYLYEPVMALFCRVLDMISVLPGDPRHQLTIIKAFSVPLLQCPRALVFSTPL